MNPLDAVNGLTLALNEVLKELQKQTELLRYQAQALKILVDSTNEPEPTQEQKEAGKNVL